MPKRPILLYFLLLMSTASTLAHNGKFALAYPVSGIQQDGDLADWPTHIPAIKLTHSVGNPLTGPADCSGTVRLAYNVEEERLYFAAEITDQEVLKGDTATVLDYESRDGFALYLNASHLQQAPGTALLMFSHQEQFIWHELHEDDPYHSFLDDDHASCTLSTKGNVTTYEGSVKLPGYIKTGRTIGVDCAAIDLDSGEGVTYLSWGPGSYREYRSGQLGDVLLSPSADLQLSNVSGEVRIDGAAPGERLRQLCVQSLDNQAFWLHTNVDTLGVFELNLPNGRYEIFPAFNTTNAFAQGGYGNQLRFDENRTTIEVQGLDREFGMELKLLPSPTERAQRKGALHDWNGQSSAKLDEFVRYVMDYHQIPGASVAVIKDARIVHQAEFGVQNTLAQDPVTPNTHFQAASVTKAVFAFIVHRLLDRNVLELDVPLHTYLPFPNLEKDARYKKMTARHVLTHQSGLPNWAFGGPGGWRSGREIELMFEPGTQFGYSGEGFEYLGRVVEHLTGKKLNTLLEEEVVQPLNVPGLLFVGRDGLEMARGHEAHYPHFWGMPGEPGVAHSMLTNARIFAPFVVALAERKGLQPETYEGFFKRQVLSEGFPPPSDSLYWNLGLGEGLFVQDTPYGKAVVHGGNNGDFQGEFVLYTEHSMGFVVFANSNAGHKLGQALGIYLMHGRPEDE